MTVEDDWLLVGRLVGAFGVRGEVKIEPETDFPERFATGKVIYVGSSHRSFTVETSRPHKKQFVLKLSGIDSPEAVQPLCGCQVTVPRHEAVDLPEGHYYYSDLIGIDVLAEGGENLGQVTDVLRTGSNDVYVVGPGESAILIPGTKEAIVELDLENRRLIVAHWVLAADG